MEKNGDIIEWEPGVFFQIIEGYVDGQYTKFYHRVPNEE